MQRKSYKVEHIIHLSPPGEPRYFVVDVKTDAILDAAWGYGYKSKANAHGGYARRLREQLEKKEQE